MTNCHQKPERESQVRPLIGLKHDRRRTGEPRICTHTAEAPA
jgi:hypothetical protein